jgi:hypothetical protein
MNHPEGRGAGGGGRLSKVEALRFAFVVEAVGAVGGDHGVLAVYRPSKMGPAGGRSVVAGVEQLQLPGGAVWFATAAQRGDRGARIADSG